MRNVYERTMMEGIERTSELVGLVGAGASHHDIEMSLIGALDAIPAWYVYTLRDSDLSQREKVRRLKNMVGRAVEKIKSQPYLFIAPYTTRIEYLHPEAGWTELFELGWHMHCCFHLLPDWQIGDDRQAILSLFGIPK